MSTPDPQPPRDTWFPGGPIAADAHRRGLLKGAEVLDEYAEGIAELPRDSEVVRECAAMLRSEADTLGETAP